MRLSAAAVLGCNHLQHSQTRSLVSHNCCSQVCREVRYIVKYLLPVQMQDWLSHKHMVSAVHTNTNTASMPSKLTLAHSQLPGLCHTAATHLQGHLGSRCQGYCFSQRAWGLGGCRRHTVQLSHSLQCRLLALGGSSTDAMLRAIHAHCCGGSRLEALQAGSENVARASKVQRMFQQRAL